MSSMNDTIAEQIIKFMGKQEIEFAFGHPGGPILPIYDALASVSKPKGITVRHEESASFMADAIGKLTGRPGLCMSTMGPGAANMLIGVATAMSDYTPMIAITGQLRQNRLGKGDQQETDHNSIYEGVTKESIQIKDPKEALKIIEKAYKISIEGRPGPVHIDLPRDVSSAKTENEYEIKKYIKKENKTIDLQEIKEAVELIKKSSCPVILSGGGTITAGASKQITELAESILAPVATSYNGRGSISEEHHLSIGRAGEFTPEYANKIISETDLIIAIGYRFTDVSIEGISIREDAKIIQIDIDRNELGKVIPIELPIRGDAKVAIESLINEVKKQGLSSSRLKKWNDNVNKAKELWKRKYQTIENSDSRPIKPQRVMKEIKEYLNDDTIITAGAGRCKMWAASVLPIRNPRTWIHSGGYAPMGYEICAGIAAKMVKPNNQVISVSGDATFQMVCQELATAVENNAPFLICALNDKSLGVIKYAQIKNYGRTFGTDFELDVNLAEVAKSFGAEGHRIERPSEIASGIEQGLKSDKPYLLDIIIDGNEDPTFRV